MGNSKANWVFKGRQKAHDSVVDLPKEKEIKLGERMKEGSRECKLFLSAGFLVEKSSYGAGQCNNAHFLCQI